jgi:hypothetical protein
VVISTPVAPLAGIGLTAGLGTVVAGEINQTLGLLFVLVPELVGNGLLEYLYAALLSSVEV